ncbi:MAG: hypothetical protein LBM20_07205 [Rikenellaceae bacterium]|jgi:hypothetical protein|nr:hypothetical protein [Rikenellaceae bacterium]
MIWGKRWKEWSSQVSFVRISVWGERWKKLSSQEKWMIALIVLLLIGAVLRWGAIKEGVQKGFGRFREEPAQAIPADSVPEDQPDALRLKEF